MKLIIPVLALIVTVGCASYTMKELPSVANQPQVTEVDNKFQKVMFYYLGTEPLKWGLLQVSYFPATIEIIRFDSSPRTLTFKLTPAEGIYLATLNCPIEEEISIQENRICEYRFKSDRYFIYWGIPDSGDGKIYTMLYIAKRKQ